MCVTTDLSKSLSLCVIWACRLKSKQSLMNSLLINLANVCDYQAVFQAADCSRCHANNCFFSFRNCTLYPMNIDVCSKAIAAPLLFACLLLLFGNRHLCCWCAGATTNSYSCLERAFLFIMIVRCIQFVWCTAEEKACGSEKRVSLASCFPSGFLVGSYSSLRDSGVASPKFGRSKKIWFGRAKMFQFRRATVFLFETPLLKAQND